MDNRLFIELCEELDNSQMYKQANEIETFFLKTSQKGSMGAGLSLTKEQLDLVKKQPTLQQKRSVLQKLVDFLTGSPPKSTSPANATKPNAPEPINPRPSVLKFDGVKGSGIQSGSFEEWKKFLESPGVEGGFSNYDEYTDPGGRTNLGITQDNMDAFTRNHKMRRIDVKSLNTNSPIYKQVLLEYWNAVKANGLPKHTAAAIADFTFNSNREKALRVIQNVLIKYGQTGVKPTGKMDPETKQAIWNLVQHDPYKDFLLAREISKARLEYVYDLRFLRDKKTGDYVMKNGQKELDDKWKSIVKKNMQGWFNRIQKLVNSDPYKINTKHEFDPTRYNLTKKNKNLPPKKKSNIKVEVPYRPEFKPRPQAV